jgi:hypothetical protein
MLTSLTPSALARIRALAAERALLLVRGDTSLENINSRLEQAIAALPPAAQSELVTLVWLGQVEPVPAWSVLLEHAVAATDASTPWYLASKLSLDAMIEKGVRVLGGEG